MRGTILQINVKPSTPGESGLPKKPVDSVKLMKAGFEGDYNRYRSEKKAGRPEMAVLVMPVETLKEIQGDGWPVEAGHIGENLTTSGIPYSALVVGKRFRVGTAEIEIAEVCEPCTTLRHLPYVGPVKITAFVKAMLNRRGMYAKVIKEGVIRKGDVIESA